MGAFLIGFAKFGFNWTLYVEYLNNIDMKQLFTSESVEITGTVLSGTDLSGDTSDTTGVYDPSMEAGIFATGAATQVTWTTLSWSTNEAYGFIKNSETWATTSNKATSVSTWAAKPVSTSWDSKAQLLNLIKSKEK